jgi:hypothetical protein
MTVIFTPAYSVSKRTGSDGPDFESGAPAYLAVREAGRQIPSLATTTRNCDQIATKLKMTGRDQCPARTGDMAAEQDK